MRWTCIPSSIIPLSNYNFPSLVCMSTSALNQQFWRQFLGIQLDTSIAIAILRKHFHIICSTRIGQWRKGKLRPTGFLKRHFLAASTGMKFFNSAYFLCVCLERMSTNQEWTTGTCMSERHQLSILFHWNDRTDRLRLTFDFVFHHPRLNTSGVYDWCACLSAF